MSRTGSEAERLDALRRLALLDTAPSEEFDRLTLLAARLFNAPVALISLIDAHRVWFKSRHGLASAETPRRWSMCDHAIRAEQVMVVGDAAADPRFAGHPLVAGAPHLRFYAGAPLITREGHAIGTLCVLDTAPREATPTERHSLALLASLVLTTIELRHSSGRLHPTSLLPNRAQFAADFADLSRAHRGESRLLALVDLADPEQLPDQLNLLGPRWEQVLPRAICEAMHTALGANVKIYHPLALRYAALLDPSAIRGWQERLDRISRILRQPGRGNGPSLAITPHIGVVPFRLGDLDFETALKRATTAAHQARAIGRVLTAAEAGTAGNDWHEAQMLIGELRRALETPGQLTLAFQPRLDFRTQRFAVAEALIRWHHPTLGTIPPAEFLPLIENTDLMGALTHWVMNAAMGEVAALRRDGIDVRVSINISAPDLQSSDIVSRLTSLLGRHDLPAKAIELEFTESILLPNRPLVHQQLQAIRDLGMEIAIDDFGTGYSNLAYLKVMPATIVKLDQSFIRVLGSSARDRAIVKAAILMAHELDYRVVAEGVESQAIAEMLAGWGCDEGQGYHIARPMDAAALRHWLRAAQPAGMSPALP